MESATQRLHRLTSYEPGRDWDLPIDDPWVIQDLEANDLSRLPWFVKRYPAGLPRLSLPRELPPTSAPAVAVLAGTAGVSPGPLDLGQLSRLLYLSAGVVRTMERPYGTHPFRAAGSAGGRFPLEVYVAVPEGELLPAGVHWYDPWDHALVQIGPPPRNGGPSSAGGPAVVVTGVPWRTGWRYRERGFRHIYWDVGTMLAQLLALADSAGLPAALYSSFPDTEVAALVGADRVHEFPVAVVSLAGADPGADPAADPAVEPGGLAVAGEVDAAPLEFPLVTAAQRAGEGGRLGSPWAPGAPVDVPALASPPVEQVITARGSQRRMDASRGLSQDLLRTSMAVALRGLDVPHWVVVHDVAGLTPGVYRWPDLDEPVRTGAMRDELYRVCLDQALARDAAFVAIAAADLAGLGDAGYRAAHLAAGLAEGRLHLAAYALGASATGMTFLDSEVPAVLGAALDGVLFTCVGVPLYRSAPGGSPGAPATVRRVAPAD
jgi:SagB-type dehydrogenase family enzyme